MTDFSTGIAAYDDRTSGSKLRQVWVDDCDVSGCQFGILYITPNYGQTVVGFADVRVTRTLLHDNQFLGFWCFGGNGAGGWNTQAANIPLGKTTFAGVTLADCEIRDNPGTDLAAGAVLFSNATGVRMTRCVGSNISYDDDSGNAAGWLSASVQSIECDSVHWSDCEAHHNATTIAGDGDGFDFDIGTTNGLMERCYSHDNNGTGLMNLGDAGNICRHCVSRNDCRTVGSGAVRWRGIAHNLTVYLDAGAAAGASATQTTANCKFLSCIFHLGSNVPVSQSGAGSPTFIGNVYWWSGGTANFDGSITTLPAWRTAGHESYQSIEYGVVANPLLSDPTTAGPYLPSSFVGTSADFDIPANSPAVGAALAPHLYLFNGACSDFHGYPNPAALGSPDAGAVSYGAGDYDPKSSGSSAARIIGG